MEESEEEEELKEHGWERVTLSFFFLKKKRLGLSLRMICFIGGIEIENENENEKGKKR